MDIHYPQLLSIVSAVVALTGFTLLAFRHSLRPHKASHEPPVIPQALPLIGHLVGIFRHGFEYFEHLAAENKLPIFTLSILTKQVHIINSPDLVVAVQKNPKVYDFSVFAIAMLPRLFDLDSKTMRLASTQIDHPGGSWNLVVETSRIMHRCLAPGPSLESMERLALTKMLRYFDELGNKPGDTVLELFAWLRTVMTIASTEAVYGPQNPFGKTAELEHALWAWEKDLTCLLLAPAPSIFARKGCHARSQLVDALTDYFEWRGHEEASEVTKARYHAGIAYGLSIPEIAHLEFGSLMGVLINSTPTFFWLLAHIYSDPQLLAELRIELSLGTMKRVKAANGSMKCTIDVPTIRQTFPLLASTYQETLRFHTHNSSSRMVTQDTTLAKQYRLKAGSIIQILGGTIHALPSIWGDDAEQFNPRRFLKTTTEDDKRKQHPGAFRSFGGGVSLCPGRHFATTEICAAAAMFVLRFDMTVVDGAGKEVNWQIPSMEVGRITSSIPLPKGDVRVKVGVREQMRDWEWSFGFGVQDAK
ncbi:MAG: hypothetical protein L6R40_006132 [Gallowayella cf. fulva]|nr:MAG: hypothetical protein L6R40_006132 [Xanthomendoza cf. fulva]